MKFRPKMTLLLFILFGLILVTFAYDHYNKKRIEEILLSSIQSSTILIQSNNFQLLSINLQSIKKSNPFLKGVGIYVGGIRRTGIGEIPESFYLKSENQEDHLEINLNGLFYYQAIYAFSHSQSMLYGEFADPNRYVTILSMYLFIFTIFYLIYWIGSSLDLDRIQEQSLRYALSLSARTLHGLKTHMIHAEKMYQILRKLEHHLNEQQKFLLDDFDFSRIEMDGHMSIMKLQTFKACKEIINIEEQINKLVQVYKKPNITSEISYQHTSKLKVDQDIFTATVGNIIKNAFDYSDFVVRIKVEENEKFLHIHIFNTGKPIPKEKLKNIFKSGFSDATGSGLGLAICKAWLDKLGSNIRIDSHDGGTVVQISFHLLLIEKNAIEVTLNKMNPNSSVKDSTIKITIIDDTKSFREELAKHLEEIDLLNKKIKTICFDSLTGFLDVLEQDPQICHLIIVDRHLRGEHAIKDRFPDSCRYLGFKGALILYSADPSSSKNPHAKFDFDLVLQKDEKIDWKKILEDEVVNL